MVPRILVLGGTGFVGRHAVATLTARGADVTVGTRSPADAVGKQQFCRLETMTSSDAWETVVAEFDVVLNCVGILRPRGQASYDRVHHLAPKAIARACAKQTRFIHVSALGLSTSDRSGFLTTKLEGERAIKASGGNWIIARPSLLDGEGGYGAAWLRGVSKLPRFAIPGDAKGQIAALDVTDLADALAQLCLLADDELDLQQSRVFELGGRRTYDFEAYIRGLRRRYTHRSAFAIPIPGPFARAGAHLCDLLRITPFSFGHWELLRKDNVPNPNRFAELLGRQPADVISHPIEERSN